MLRLSKWDDRLFINCIAIAIGVGAIVLYGLAAAGIGFHFGIKPIYVIGIAVGAILFGVGIAISGYVPGTEWMALGEARREAIYAVFGGLLGAASWTLLYQTPAGHWLTTTMNYGMLYLGGKVGTNLTFGFELAIIWFILMMAVAYFLPRYKRGKSCAYTMTHSNYKFNTYELNKHKETSEILIEGSNLPIGKNDRIAKDSNYSWAPRSNLRGLLTLVGAIIGIAVVAGMFLHQIFGESTTYSWMVGYLFLPGYSYSKLVFNTIGWEPFSDIGTLLGAFIAAIFVTRRFQSFNKWTPSTWRLRFGDSEIKRAVGVFIGSYLVLFGARMAGGCASGHILSGSLQMALSSIEFFAIVAISLLVTGKILYGKVNTDIFEPKIRPKANKPERQDEHDVKAFVAIMSIFVVVVAALAVGTYNGYAPNPNDVAITGFVMLFTLLFTAVWYKQKYSTYSHKMYEDNTGSEYYKG
ncbi:MAG: YeeE/YedE thiosulfate transporter family protein [Candidatus Micrarchaeia archaeon]